MAGCRSRRNVVPVRGTLTGDGSSDPPSCTSMPATARRQRHARMSLRRSSGWHGRISAASSGTDRDAAARFPSSAPTRLRAAPSSNHPSHDRADRPRQCLRHALDVLPLLQSRLRDDADGVSAQRTVDVRQTRTRQINPEDTAAHSNTLHAVDAGRVPCVSGSVQSFSSGPTAPLDAPPEGAIFSPGRGRCGRTRSPVSRLIFNLGKRLNR
jgi:hypothetical protein